MDLFLKKHFTSIYVGICFLVFIVICLRAFFIPFSHDESSTFFFYIQSNNYLPYKAHVYTNNHVLNSALANLCYHLAGSHRFVLRLPNVLCFLVLCFGLSKFFTYLTKTSSRLILIGFFILTFNFLDFFELCRGYGLSMAFMVAGLAYLQDYFSGQRFKKLLLFSVCWQLALAANLIFVILLALFLILIFLFQIRQKLFLARKNIFLQTINAALLIFWIKFSFFYKSKGVLDSGIGEDYWVVTFKSLIYFIFGTDALWIQILVVVFFLLMLTVTLFLFFRKSLSIDALFVPRYFYTFILCCLITGFYLQKKILGVNYPEDRTGLFFYVFFALSVAFFLEQAPKMYGAVLAVPFVSATCVYFVFSFNLSSFTNYFYHVLPKSFYTYLEQEFHKRKQLFTVGGHINREMNYAFANYRGGGMLNPMDVSPEMCMNCDYYIALNVERPYYTRFYEEVAYDYRWNRVLLKRKQPIRRIELSLLNTGSKNFGGKDEFYEWVKFGDSINTSRNCIEAEMEVNFQNVPKPFNAFVVLQVNDENDHAVYYKRLLLNWIADDLNGVTKRFKLTSGPLPAKFKSIVVYLWNIDKKDLRFTLKDLKIYDLTAPGINFVIPRNYYPYIEKMTHEHLL